MKILCYPVRMFVIGTAGHVDHGKSTLVKALTGIDPDRLKEEQVREMTIDLGFAWLQLPSGEEVSVVDVPGHERFVKNMLAGVGGMDLAMLIVAADEGVMPQTREHLSILDLLQVKKGMVVVTKKDLVDSDFLELVSSDVAEVLKGTALEGSRIVPVSAITGEGLDDLKRTLAEMLNETPERKDVGRPRLPIDRAFIMTGFGAVVTGTLVDGSVEIGQEVEIAPDGLRARVRGLQSHRKKLEKAGPGRRLAVNLSGVNFEQLHRGQVLTVPGWLTATSAIDARLRVVKGLGYDLKHNATVTFHSGTFESPAKVRLLDADALGAGETCWGQIKTDNDAPVVKGDLFILRDSRGTVAGGEVVELQARRHRRFEAALLSHLEALGEGTHEERVLEGFGARQPVQVKALAPAAGLSQEDVLTAVGTLITAGRVQSVTEGELKLESLVCTAVWVGTTGEKASAALADFHRKYPLRKGLAREELRNRLELQSGAFIPVLRALSKAGLVTEEGPMVRLPSHAVALDDKLRAEAERYVRALAANPYSPPSDIPIDPELLGYLLEEGCVVRASPEVVYAAEAYREMIDRVTVLIKTKGSASIADVRDLFGSSRKYVLALLEQMDQQRLTRRVGDDRVLR